MIKISSIKLDQSSLIDPKISNIYDCNDVYEFSDSEIFLKEIKEYLTTDKRDNNFLLFNLNSKQFIMLCILLNYLGIIDLLETAIILFFDKILSWEIDNIEEFLSKLPYQFLGIDLVHSIINGDINIPNKLISSISDEILSYFYFTKERENAEGFNTLKNFINNSSKFMSCCSDSYSNYFIEKQIEDIRENIKNDSLDISKLVYFKNDDELINDKIIELYDEIREYIKTKNFFIHCSVKTNIRNNKNYSLHYYDKLASKNDIYIKFVSINFNFKFADRNICINNDDFDICLKYDIGFCVVCACFSCSLDDKEQKIKKLKKIKEKVRNAIYDTKFRDRMLERYDNDICLKKVYSFCKEKIFN